MQAPKLRVQAQQLSKRFCSAIQMGVLKNLDSLRVTHMREENDVQVGCHTLHRLQTSAPGLHQPCKREPCQCWSLLSNAASPADGLDCCLGSGFRV